MDRKLVLFGVFTALMVFSGCTTQTSDNGEFRLLISDEEADISDFDSLNVTVEEVRLEPANESEEFFTVELDEPRTVDLTSVIGDRAQEIINESVPAGEYQKVDLWVEDQYDSPGNVRRTRGLVNQSVVDSEEGPQRFITEREVQVMVPSGRLQIDQNFTVSPNRTVDFIFDISVVLKGATEEYNLQPDITASGVEGEDVDEHEEVEPPELPEQAQ